MTSRTGLYTIIAGMALGAACTLAFILPGLADTGESTSPLTAVGISLLMGGRLLGVMLMVVGLLMIAIAESRKLSVPQDKLRL
jgi:hypothetical protein